MPEKKVCRSGSRKERLLSHDHTKNLDRETSRKSSPKQHSESTVAKDGEDGLSEDHTVKMKQVSEEAGKKSPIRKLLPTFCVLHTVIVLF